MTEVTKDSTVQVHYIGTLTETKEIFDTSREDVAKENEVFNEGRDYAPLPVQMGQQQVIKGFEEALLGMKVGDRKSVDLSVADSYGERIDELAVEVPDEEFTKAEVTPQVGMMIATSNGNALITAYNEETKFVTLDFNHPLAGQKLTFDLEVMKIE
ncbi:MAG: FKBP-type peptidyl-prolyl cis-trans isomerase [Candidatus Kariarchaeaceae archaeon]|jgi:FKBP-type peptidyl-prolyl cis-trans isomerase 2